MLVYLGKPEYFLPTPTRVINTSEQFSIKCRKLLRIGLVSLVFALLLVQKIRTIPSTNQMKLKTIATWSGAFSRASSSLLVFIFEFSLASDKGSFCPIYQLGYFWFLVFRHALDNWPKTRKICYLLSLLIPYTRYLIATSHAHCSEVLTCDIPGFPRINIRTISRNMRNSR